MADLKKALLKIRHNEGGLTLKEADRGNWTGGAVGEGELIGTKYGVSAPQLSSYLGRTATKQDMLNLTREQAEEIYRVEYWQVMKGDEIIDQEIAEEIFDMGINAGIGTGIKLFQKRYNLSPTGKMDAPTLKFING